MDKKQAKFMLYGQVFGMAKAGHLSKVKLRAILRSKQGTQHPKYLDHLCNFLMMRFNARYYQLAYGFLRGKPYAKIEQKVGEHNKPNALMVLEVFKTLMNEYDLRHNKISVESIREWINALSHPENE